MIRTRLSFSLLFAIPPARQLRTVRDGFSIAIRRIMASVSPARSGLISIDCRTHLRLYRVCDLPVASATEQAGRCASGG